MKKITINTDIQDCNQIKMNPEQLQRLIDNTISNAIKYSKEKTTIYISLRKEEENISLVFEDEGRNIGKDYLPDHLAGYLSGAPLLILETAMKERTEITFEEYVVAAQMHYHRAGFPDPLLAWRDDIQSALARIHKRLGGLRHQTVSAYFDDAFEEQRRSGSLEAHKVWVEYLLREYYDPMYDYQIQKRSDQIQLRGEQKEILDYLQAHQ